MRLGPAPLLSGSAGGWASASVVADIAALQAEDAALDGRINALETKSLNVGTTLWMGNSTHPGVPYDLVADCPALWYTPLLVAGDVINGSVPVEVDGFIQIKLLYSMSAAQAQDIVLRLDYALIGENGSPTTALAGNLDVTSTPGANTGMHTITPASWRIAATAGQLFVWQIERRASAHTGEIRIPHLRGIR